MNKFFKLSERDRIEIINQTVIHKKLPAEAIEKDVWVTGVLQALFTLPYAKNLSFKGGTSLSKCYNLIERLSEDIDIAVSREKPDLTGTNTSIRNKLRRVACKFVREELQFDVKKQLENNGINPNHFSVNVNITPITTTDPETIEVVYHSLFNNNNYIKPIVKIEVSGRSMSEPLQIVKLQSIVDEAFVNMPFVNTPFDVNAVVPQRTFIEKICLLHEEFAKPQKFMRTERMSRHLYDLEKIMDTPIAEEALKNKKLYNSVVEHRRIFIGLNGFDYSSLAPHTINIIPPNHIINLWKADYETMQGTMIYGDSLPFNELIDRIKQLNERINRIDW